MHDRISHSFVALGGEVLVAKNKLATEYRCALRVTRVIKNR